MKYLPDLLSGKKIGAFGLTEPNAGTDASGQQTTAVLEGDHYVLNGSKCFITNGTVASTMVVFAMTDPKAGNHGISASSWRAPSPASPSVRRRRRWYPRFFHLRPDLRGLHRAQGEPAGQGGPGFKIAMQTLDAAVSASLLRLWVWARAPLTRLSSILRSASSSRSVCLSSRTPSSSWLTCTPA